MLQLRKLNNMTQEQLAEKLFVSRAAISKWESKKGYPNIESLKAISKLFGVSIDELLSSEELITLAQTENKKNIKKIYNIIMSVIDIFAIFLIILPLYGKTINGYIYSVNLFEFNDTTMILVTYWTAFLTLNIAGILELTSIFMHKEKIFTLISKFTIIIDIITICFLAAAREPYVTVFLFLFFIIKVITLQREHKS